jgi:hypothetical protein
METGRPNPHSSPLNIIVTFVRPPASPARKILPFPKKPSHGGCFMCHRLASGEALWMVTREGSSRLFQPLDDTRYCPECGAPVEAVR